LKNGKRAAPSVAMPGNCKGRTFQQRYPQLWLRFSMRIAGHQAAGSPFFQRLADTHSVELSNQCDRPWWTLGE
jgi:hypothetical protein